MEQFLDTDCLRVVQILVNTVQKWGKIMQKNKKKFFSENEKMWLANKLQKYIRTNQVPQSAGNPVGSQAGNLKFASGKIAGIQSNF